MDDSNFRHGVQEILLVPKGGGIFEVTVDNQLLFSKKELGRFPEPSEVPKLIRNR